MTHPNPVPPLLYGYQPGRQPCSGCGASHARGGTVDGVHGYRCPDCPPRFSLAHALRLAADRGDVGAYLRTCVAHNMPGLDGAA